MIKKLKKIFYVLKFELLYRRNSCVIPVVYFDEVVNVGDILNVYLIERLTKKKVIRVPHQKKHHILCVGSVVGSMNSHSVVAGSGLIAESHISYVKGLGNILALRGKLTKSILSGKFNSNIDVPLGDPAVLMSDLYTPKKMVERYSVGLVLHYVDENDSLISLAKSLGFKVISVKQDVESFIDEINSCNSILSSSMHGLILADTYNIPNKWLTFSNNIVGNGFKFQDYYSVTDSVEENTVHIRPRFEKDDFLNACRMVSIKRYMGNRLELRKALECMK